MPAMPTCWRQTGRYGSIACVVSWCVLPICEVEPSDLALFIGWAKRSEACPPQRIHVLTFVGLGTAHEGARLCPPYGSSVQRRSSQPEHIQHRRVTLILQLRRIHELGPGRTARPRRYRHVLLAVDLECHRRRRET